MNTMNNNKPLYRCAGLCIDLDVGEIKNPQDDSLRLSPINRRLLMVLTDRAGELVTRQELFDAVWPNQLVNDDVLTRAMSDIRTQLAKLNAAEKFIETLPKRGYRWLPELTAWTAEAMSTADVPVTELITTSATVRSQSPLWRTLVLYVVIAAFATMLISAWISKSAQTPSLRVVLLSVFANEEPTSAEENVNRALREVLRNYPGINLLARNALGNDQQNPMPYLYSEFDVHWVIESRVTRIAGQEFIELSLVDAQTGVEQRAASVRLDNNKLPTLLLRALDEELILAR